MVSAENECDFCVSSHQVNLVDLFGYAGERVDAITDGDYSGLSERERATLEFAQEVAIDPKRVIDADVESLRDVGYEDAEIVELVGAIAQYVAANVYADTFAIEPYDRDD